MNKIRVSLSLDRTIISLVDSHVDGIVMKSRSQAVERFLAEYLSDKRTAVLLAGGKIEDLLVEGTNTLRPLADIGGRLLVEDNLRRCREAGYTNILIVGSSKIISKIYEVLGDGKKYGVSIRYIEDELGLGSAKTLERAREYIKSDFLFLPCDHYFEFNLGKMREFHLMNGALATIAVHAKTVIDPMRFGIVEMEGSRITSMEEHPKKPRSNLVSVFVGFMKPEVFNYIPPGNMKWSLQENVFPRLAREGRMCGYPVPGNWVNIHDQKDIGKVRRL